jgi:hypothetical protein
VKTIGLFPDFVETWYSKGFYPKLAFLSRKALGWLPFSLGDVISDIELGFCFLLFPSYSLGNELLPNSVT